MLRRVINRNAGIDSPDWWIKWKIGSPQEKSNKRGIYKFERSILPRLYGNGDGVLPYSPRYHHPIPLEENHPGFVGSLTPTLTNSYVPDYQI